MWCIKRPGLSRSITRSNEYHTILFAIDKPTIIEATQIILLNGFLKKSNKDYRKQIEIAQTILNDLEQ